MLWTWNVLKCLNFLSQAYIMVYRIDVSSDKEKEIDYLWKNFLPSFHLSGRSLPEMISSPSPWTKAYIKVVRIDVGFRSNIKR